MSIKLIDFLDLQDAILEELKLQSTDSVARARIKRIINEVYINEVVPYARWKWLEGNTAIRFNAAYSDGTVTVTPNSQTVTLSTTPSVSLGSFAGYYFSSNNLNEIYIIESHTAGSATVTISSEYLGEQDDDANFRIWTDKVNLPTDVRETVTVWHNMRSSPMKPLGWQKFREISLISPKAEGYPSYYYTGDYKDPSVSTGEYESDRYRQLRLYPSIYSKPVTINIDYIKDVTELVNDADEPVLPIEDRIVLKYAALKTAWRTIGRNPEEAMFSAQEYQAKIDRMAGKIEDSQDKPRIQPDSLYIKRRRAPKFRVGGFSSDLGSAGSGGSTSATPTYLEDVTINGATLTNNMTVSSGITIDGVDISVLSSDFVAHLADTVDAHDASAISFIPVGTIAATEVQSAIAEVATDAATATALKADSASPTFTGTITTPLTASRAVVTGASSELAISTTTATELGYVNGVTSAIQTQINTKAPSASPTFTGTVTTPVTASRALVTGASSEIAAATTTATEIGYVNGVTSAIQTQLDAKQARSTLTTKGDLYVATASATVARQAVGADGTFLKADSAQTNGVTWASVAGSALAVTTKTTTYTATTSDDVILCTSASAWTLTLYAASGNSGKILTIKKTSSDTNAITIDGNASETIDGATTTTIDSQYETLKIICDGTNWHILERKINENWASITITPAAGFGTTTNGAFFGRRMGDSLEVKGYFKAGTVAASAGSFDLSGLTIDTAKIPGAGKASLGTWNSIASAAPYGSGNRVGPVFWNSGTSTLNISASGSTDTFGVSNVTEFLGSNNGMAFHFTVPISGWKGN